MRSSTDFNSNMEFFLQKMLRVVVLFMFAIICIHAQDFEEEPKQYEEFYAMCGSPENPPRECDCADGSQWKLGTGGNIDICNPLKCTCRDGKNVPITMFGCSNGGRPV